MTFIAPSRPADIRGSSFLLNRRGVKAKGRPLMADEDGARRALCTEGGPPMVALAGSSIEHLARIALG